VVLEWKLVGEAVSDGIQRIYGSSSELHSCRRDANSAEFDVKHDALTYRIPRVVYGEESDRYETAENVDESVSRAVWPTPEYHVVSETNNRKESGGENFVRSVPHLGMSSTTSDEVKSRRYSKCGACVKGFLTFLFSTVGLTCLLIAYSIVGGLVFMQLEAGTENRTADAPERLVFVKLEAETENRTADEMERLRREQVERLWDLTTRTNVLHPDVWMTEADDILKNYTTVVYKYTKVRGWDAGGRNEESQWSFAGSLLYAITVITTIGTRTCRLVIGIRIGLSFYIT